MRSIWTWASLLGAAAFSAAMSSELMLRNAEALIESTAVRGLEERQSYEAKQAAAMRLMATMPKCGLACIEIAVETSPCTFGDTSCTCNNMTIAAQAAQCIAVSCTVRETLSTKNISDTICGRPVRSKSDLAVGSGVAGLIFAIVTFIVRILSKIHIQFGAGSPISTDLWWDDLAVTLSMIFVTGFCIMSVPLAKLGYARDVWTIPFENLSPIIKLTWIDEIFYVFGLGLVKISLLLTYLRFFSSNRFRQITYIVIALNVAFVLSYFIVIICQCQPISYIWTKWDGEHKGTCLPINPIVWSAAVINIILDFLVLGLPIFQLWRMNLNKRKKFLVMLMFGVGFLVTVTSIMRLQAIVDYGQSTNFTWVRVEPGVWSKLELQLSVICACMPAIRQVIRRFSPRLIGDTGSEGTTTGISTTQSGLSGRTIAMSADNGKSTDTEYFVPLEDMRPPQSKSSKFTISQVSEKSMD